MNNLFKKYPKQVDIGIMILWFALGANYFVFLKFSGLRDIGVELVPSSFGFHWAIPTLAGISIGLCFSLLEFKVFPKISALVSRWTMIGIWFFSLTLSIILSAIVIRIFSDIVFYNYSLSHSFQLTKVFLFSGLFATLFVYLMMLGTALNFLRTVGNKFGHGILINYISGKYRKPVEENRIFMFIDLNGSTKIAEQLGHVKYSRFLNKCFGDLSKVLLTYDAEIYQYVGDEAVITWNADQLKKPSKAAFLFFEFKRLLQHNKKTYLDKFGVFPTFKASINAGDVTVTELGARKKELVYHGDVLNTTSRVLELCNQSKKQLLITSKLFESFKAEANLAIQFVSDIVLRGKDDITTVYSVDEV